MIKLKILRGRDYTGGTLKAITMSLEEVGRGRLDFSRQKDVTTETEVGVMKPGVGSGEPEMSAASISGRS